jgi:hypothetical protein
MKAKRAARVVTHCILAAAAIAVVGCGGGEESGAGGGTPDGGAATASGGAPGSAGSVGASSGSSTAAADAWNKAEVVRRLEEAGLVVTDSGKEAHNPSLHASGEELTVSGGQLQIYIYPDDAARERDAAGLDTTRKGLPSIYDPIYIISGNLIAILHTPKERLAERVKLVLQSRHGG